MRYDLLIWSMEWSYSRLTAYEDCPYLWLQRYILNVPGKPNFFAQYGGLMHTIIQKYLTGSLNKNELVSYYLAHFQAQVTEKAPSSKTYLGYLEQGRQYLKTLSLPARMPLKVEDEMHFTFAGYPFVGFLDLMWEDERGKLYITDHKSRALKPRSKRTKPTKTDIELDQYLRQLYIYAHAVYTLYGRYPDYLEFNCFRTNTWITEPFSVSRLHEVEDWAENLIRKIVSESKWSAEPDFWFCKQLCDTREECEYQSLL